MLPPIPAYYLEIAVVALGLVLLMADAFATGADRRWIGWTAICGLLVVFALNFNAIGGASDEGFWKYYTYEAGSFAGFYKGIAILATIFVLLLGMEYLPVIRSAIPRDQAGGEFFVLPLFTCAGLMWAASSVDLVSVFVSIELVTISFYVLVAYLRRNVGSLEAGVKYLILGALATGFMVYGITWIFGATGTTSLAGIAAKLNQGDVNVAAVMFGFVLLLAALGFKVGAFPFSVWIPDVYQGAPTPVTAYLATASKAAGFIVLIRILEPFLQTGYEAAAVGDRVVQILMMLAGATLLFGSLAAITQSNFKRLLAYSGISQAGFLLLALACSPVAGEERGGLAPIHVVSFGLASYLLTATLAFAVLTVVRTSTGAEDLGAFKGLHQRSPFLAFVLLVAMIGLAGVPLTSGFITKAFVFWFAVQAHAWVLLGAAIVAGAAGFYYYLKVLRFAYLQPAVRGGGGRIPVSPVMRVVMSGLAVGILWFGIAPRPLFNMTEPVEALQPGAMVTPLP